MNSVTSFVCEFHVIATSCHFPSFTRRRDETAPTQPMSKASCPFLTNSVCPSGIHCSPAFVRLRIVPPDFVRMLAVIVKSLLEVSKSLVSGISTNDFPLNASGVCVFAAGYAFAPECPNATATPAAF